MTILALEVPLSGPARCWMADDREDYVARTLEAAAGQGTGWAAGTGATFDDAVAHNARGLRRATVYLTVDEAAAALEGGLAEGGDALRAAVELRSWEITDPVVAVRYGAEVEAVLRAEAGQDTVTLSTAGGELIATVTLPQALDDAAGAHDAVSGAVAAIRAQGIWVVRSRGPVLRVQALRRADGQQGLRADVMASLA